MIVHAPGKVVLLGEYAVLDGAPALVAAVDRGVSCTVEDADEREVEAPGDTTFVRAALEAVDAPPARYRFADWNPIDSPTKVGLGGSAAATVAAVVAGLRRAGRSPSPAEVHAIAARVHHAVQGSGSGLDVAASAHGGVIRFEAGAVAPVAPVRPSIVFSGTSAATGPRVRTYLGWGPREAFVRASRELVDGFAADPVGALEAGGRLLREMAARAGLPYWTDGIDALVALARSCGGAAKPSGAGGGDIVVALFPDPDDRRRYEAAAAARGFLVVPVSVAPAAG